MQLRTPTDAFRLLVDLGATPWLVRHHELVVEAMELLAACVERELGVSFDRESALLGAALHDAGKIAHVEEMTAPGHRHELDGEALLRSHGVPAAVSRFCRTHASWGDIDRSIEDLLVALADKLWKGKRESSLEELFVQRVAEVSGRQAWEVFDKVDEICEAVASEGPARLRRSRD